MYRNILRASVLSLPIVFFGLCATLAPRAALAAGTRVAIVNMDAVAKALGSDVQIKHKLQQANQKYGRELRAYVRKLQGELNKEAAKFGKTPSKADREKLVRMRLEAQARVQHAVAEARQRTVRLQQTLTKEFQDKVRPVAARIAKAHHAGVVLTTGFVLWYESGVDITRQVIAAMKHK